MLKETGPLSAFTGVKVKFKVVVASGNFGEPFSTPIRKRGAAEVGVDEYAGAVYDSN